MQNRSPIMILRRRPLIKKNEGRFQSQIRRRPEAYCQKDKFTVEITSWTGFRRGMEGSNVVRGREQVGGAGVRVVQEVSFSPLFLGED